MTWWRVGRNLAGWAIKISKEGEGEGGTFSAERLCPGVQSLTLSYTLFDCEVNPFRIPFIDKWYTFSHAYQFLEVCMPYNCCKCTTFFNMNKSQNQNVSRIFTAIKCMCLSFWALTDRKDNFPIPFHKLQLVKSLPFYVPDAWKRYLNFLGGAYTPPPSSHV